MYINIQIDKNILYLQSNGCRNTKVITSKNDSKGTKQKVKVGVLCPVQQPEKGPSNQ